MGVRILIRGDRHWRCDDLAEQIVNRLIARNGPDLVIAHGGAPGVDNAFATACRELGIVAESQHADWHHLGKIAGPTRNREMVEAGADLCIALHRSIETSKGTKDCVRQALAAGIPVWLVEDDQARPEAHTGWRYQARSTVAAWPLCRQQPGSREYSSAGPVDSYVPTGPASGVKRGSVGRIAADATP